MNLGHLLSSPLWRHIYTFSHSNKPEASKLLDQKHMQSKQNLDLGNYEQTKAVSSKAILAYIDLRNCTSFSSRFLRERDEPMSANLLLLFPCLVFFWLSPLLMIYTIGNHSLYLILHQIWEKKELVYGECRQLFLFAECLRSSLGSRCIYI